MKKLSLLAVASLFVAALVTGCGGGGSSSAPGVPGLPKQGKDRVIITWSGPGHSMKPNMQVRSHDTVQTSPIQIGTANNYPNSESFDFLSGQEQADITVTVVDPQGSPVPEPTPTLSAGDPSLVTTDTRYMTASSTLNSGTTTLTASFPDGNSGSIAVLSYPSLATACYGNGFRDSAEGWSYATGQPVAVTDPSQADVSMQGDTRCTPPFQGPGYTLEFPNGYELLSTSGIFSGVTSVGTFVSAGTSLDVPTFLNEGAPIIIFKTSTGLFVKWWIRAADGADAVVGETLVSDTNGNFAY